MPHYFLSACGFSPVYNENNHAKLVQKLAYKSPIHRMNLSFIHILIDRFGDLGDKYILNYVISTSKKDRALDFDGTVHRIEISGSVSFNLNDREKWN